MKKILILLAACLVGLVACSHGNGNSAGGGSGKGGGGTPASAYMGTKAPDMAKEVGDIVFNDGSATPYTQDLELTKEQKTAAIAVIFYKGTDLNSGESTASRTLGVGLKQNKTGVYWCTNLADAYELNITTIQCPASGSARALQFVSGDRNGSDNLEQIGEFAGVTDTTGAGAKDLYPAFYFAKNYTVGDGEYTTGWYLPSIAEIFQIFACMKDTESGADIDAAIELCAGDKFETERYYWTATQFANDSKIAYGFTFGSGDWVPDEKSGDGGVGQKGYACAIREF
ncbi:MAG: hypothetical protein J5726_09600 [Treponema sp.]|nr:hypothetical protein [Treponema sp.]